MTAEIPPYYVRVQSNIARLGNDALKIFLQLNKYHVVDYLGASCIPYNNLQDAQRTESKLREMFEVILIDNRLNERVVRCLTFKPSGKWYSEEDVLIPLHTPEWDVHDQISVRRHAKTLVYVGRLANHVPFMVPSE